MNKHLFHETGLAIRNNFKFHRDSVQRVETIRLAPYQQEELAEMVSELPTPSGNSHKV